MLLWGGDTGHEDTPLSAANKAVQPDPLSDAVELNGIPNWNEEIQFDDIEAQLNDYDEEDDNQPRTPEYDSVNDNDSAMEEDTEEHVCDDTNAASTMDRYLQAIQERLKFEVRESTGRAEKWLVALLEENDWWVRQCKAKWLCAKLNILFEDEVSYYRDVLVWLPEQR